MLIVVLSTFLEKDENLERQVINQQCQYVNARSHLVHFVPRVITIAKFFPVAGLARDIHESALLHDIPS